MTQKLPKTVLFDMDGVLIDSMPTHVDVWTKLYKTYDIDVTEEYLYGEEGRVAVAAIAKLFKDRKNQELTLEERKAIHNKKAAEVKTRPIPPAVEDMVDFVQLVKETSNVSVVTGSAQKWLMDTLSKYYPNCFDTSKMISAKDVKFGKPHPEPYLLGAQKHGTEAHEAFVVENAPLGIKAGKAAGMFVIAINIGKLSNQDLLDAGADVVFNSAKEMTAWWKAKFLS